MNQGPIWGRFMKKTRGQKSRATVPLRQAHHRIFLDPSCQLKHDHYITLDYAWSHTWSGWVMDPFSTRQLGSIQVLLLYYSFLYLNSMSCGAKRGNCGQFIVQWAEVFFQKCRSFMHFWIGTRLLRPKYLTYFFSLCIADFLVMCKKFIKSPF